MDSKITLHSLFAPIGWLLGVIIAAIVAGYSYAGGRFGWFAAMLAMVGICVFMLIKAFLNFGKRIRYILNATLNGDFSYKFPTVNVSKYERDSNVVLNRIVEHLEQLSMEIRQKESFLEKVINMTDIGMIVADGNGNVRLHNDSALRLLQRPALTHICQITPQAFAQLSIARHDSILNGKPIQIYTINDLRHPIQTAEVESWEKLIRVLTHEIMNSLTPIHSIAETMKEKTTSPETEDAFATISSSSRSLMSFVKSFRKFSVLPEVQMRAVYLKPLLENCVNIGKAYAHNHHIEISLQCFPPDVMVYTDESLLIRVITNILKNAVEASSGKISIEAQILRDESVEIKICNDGELIPEEIAEQIFTPFFTTRFAGSGIGLSLSRRIITHLGGTLTLQTLPRTSFIIRL